MLVLTRYRVTVADARAFRDQAVAAVSVLAAQPGYLRGRVGRATDDPSLWVLVTEWDGVGAYRRALSAYDVRVTAVPLLSRALDETSAFEVLVADDGPQLAGSDPWTEHMQAPSRRAADAGTVGLGTAAGPFVPTDLD